MDERERDLTEATTELSDTLESLRAELVNGPRGDRPPGLPRPPTPTELLRFTEHHTIPATIALLEAAIRSLELLAAVLRVVDGRPMDAVSGETSSRSPLGGRDRLAETSRETLRRLDDALVEFQSAARGEPSNPELQRLLAEARDLRSEVDARLAEATDAGGDSAPVDEAGDNSANTRGGSDPDHVEIDVDEELASIKRSVDEDSDSENDGPPKEP
ncbi:MAG: DUF7547 family protein [Halobacteriota archaeon]|uniref:DUF7547 family protein n=1 Tax=Natronomonas sp. TaxID=2184060 RepID=UPI003975245E